MDNISKPTQHEMVAGESEWIEKAEICRNAYKDAAMLRLLKERAGPKRWF